MKRLVITALCAIAIAALSPMAHAEEIYWDQNSPPDVTTKPDKSDGEDLVGVGLDKLGAEGIYDMPQRPPESEIDPGTLEQSRRPSPMPSTNAPAVRRSRGTIETPRAIRSPRSRLIEQPRPVERAVTPGNDPITETGTPQSKQKGPAAAQPQEDRDKSGIQWGRGTKPETKNEGAPAVKEKKNIPWGKVDVKPSGPSEGGLKWGR